MHEEAPTHQRCPWCGICLKCQSALAKEFACGDPQKECARAKRFRNLNPNATKP